MAQIVDYYMSTSSPWTYLGSNIFTEMTQKIGAKVNVFPVNFSSIFPVSGGLPLPKRAPQRQAYRLMELKRWKQRRNSIMHIQPKNFPSIAPISSLAIVAAREMGEDALTLSNAILKALWEEDQNIDDIEIIKQVCDVCKLSSGLIIDNASSTKIMKIFEKDTENAIQKGVFGAPTYVIDNELFWGQDRLDFVDQKLNGSQ